MRFLSVHCLDGQTHSQLREEGGRVISSTRLDNAQARDTRDLLMQALLKVSSSFEDTTFLFALPGLQAPPQSQGAARLVEEILPPGARAGLCDAMDPILLGALGARPGVVFHCARLAAVTCLAASGEVGRVVSQGEMLGDEGSALWMGSRTLQLVARGQRPGMPRSQRLEEALLEHLGAPSVEEVLQRFERGHLGVSELLAVSRLSVDLSAYPDPEVTCRALLLRLSRALLALAQQLPHSPERASWDGPAMGQALQEELRAQLSVPLDAPRYPGDLGCHVLARATAMTPGEERVTSLEAPAWRLALEHGPRWLEEV